MPRAQTWQSVRPSPSASSSSATPVQSLLTPSQIESAAPGLMWIARSLQSSSVSLSYMPGSTWHDVTVSVDPKPSPSLSTK